jgi:hypothetical protein
MSRSDMSRGGGRLQSAPTPPLTSVRGDPPHHALRARAGGEIRPTMSETVIARSDSDEAIQTERNDWIASLALAMTK